jgi:phage baseplate assembly protein W
MAQPIIEKTIALPFSINSFGSVNSTTDPQKIWADRVTSVIGTMVGERVFRPTFGTSIPKHLFDVSKGFTAATTNDIIAAFSVQLPALSFKNVQSSFDASQNVVTLDVSYSIPGSTHIKRLVAKVAVDGTKQPLEVNK